MRITLAVGYWTITPHRVFITCVQTITHSITHLETFLTLLAVVAGELSLATCARDDGHVTQIFIGPIIAILHSIALDRVRNTLPASDTAKLRLFARPNTIHFISSSVLLIETVYLSITYIIKRYAIWSA
jgi:hypothetical protein